MMHELKIIISIGMETFDYENDSMPQIVKIFYDNERISLIQNFKLEASVNDILPKVEITFPNLEKFASHESIVKTIDHNMMLLKKIAPNINVLYEEDK